MSTNPTILTKVDGGDYLTAKEAADVHNCEITTIRSYIASGKLTLYKFKTLALVYKYEVLDLPKTRGKTNGEGDKV